MQEILRQIQPLTPHQHDRARRAARKRVKANAGAQPTKEQFARTIDHEYPPILMVIVAVLALALLVAFFTQSAMRLYDVGSGLFADEKEGSFTFMWLASDAHIAGLSVVLGAEIGQVVFTLAQAVLVPEVGKRHWGFIIGAVLCTAIALVGNADRAGLLQATRVFQVIDALAPPIIVLAGADVLKHVALVQIRRRHAIARQYDKALDQWRAAQHDPEDDPQWTGYYADALKRALTSANRKQHADTLTTLDRDGWYALIAREIQSDTWFEDRMAARAIPEIQPEIQPVQKAGEIHPESPAESGARAPRAQLPVNFRLQGQARVLDFLERVPAARDMEQKDIAEWTDVSPSTVSRAVTKAQQNGHGHE